MIDMPLSPELAAWLRKLGHDAVHAGDVGLHKAADSEIMSRAYAEGRTIVTADLDYPQLLALTKASEPSIILFRDGNWSDDEVIAKLAEVLAALTPPEIAQSIITVERKRIRRRRLPL